MTTSFEIVKVENGYKVLYLSNGVEYRRTHHKTEALALAKCQKFNPNLPIVNKCRG